MLTIRVEKFTDLAVVECQGRIMHSDSVFKLRDAVQSQEDARVIAVDLSEVEAIGGGGLGMLVFLEHWAQGERDSIEAVLPFRTGDGCAAGLTGRLRISKLRTSRR